MAYVLTHFEVPDELCVCHSCDNRACVNPKHLFLGTQKDNIHDAVKKGRLMCGWHLNGAGEGERHPNAKLTRKQVRNIRERYRPRIVTQKQLAKEYGVTRNAIGAVVREEIWRGSDSQERL